MSMISAKQIILVIINQGWAGELSPVATIAYF